MRTIYRDIVGVGAFIFSKDGYVLMGKSTRATYEGCWIIPSGAIDEGEAAEEAVIREVREETGIDVSGQDIVAIEGILSGESEKILKGSGERVIGKYTFHNFVIKLEKSRNEITVNSQDDFSEATWHNIKTLKNLKLSPPSITTLKKLGYL